MAFEAAYAVPHPPLILPEVGRGREEAIADTVASYKRVASEIAAVDPEVIVVTSPHAPCYRDGFYVSSGVRAWGDMARFAAKSTMAIAYDEALQAAIRANAEQAGLPLSNHDPRDSEVDHATFIPLWFVDRAYEEQGRTPGYKVVRVGLSGLGYEAHRVMGRAIGRAVFESGRRAVLVASGDLSHKLTADGPYGFAKEGPEFDQRICDIFDSGELEDLFGFDPAFADRAAECGLQSFQIMAAALAWTPGSDCGDMLPVSWTSELLSYEGPFGVGYGVARIVPAVPEGDQVDPYVALARASVEHFVRERAVMAAPSGADSLFPNEMTDCQAGVFVSLHKNGMLRGCMGTIAGTQPSVAQEIIRNGVLACSQDPRFAPVAPDELDYLEYSVDVLGEPELISSADELDPKRYGVIVSTATRRGLLLPNLDGVDTVEYQVAIARQKAGIHPREENVMMQRFEVVRHVRGGEPRK